MELLSSSQIKRILQIPDLQRSTLNKAESVGNIPTAKRVRQGSIDARKWQFSDLPQIGKKYGKFSSPMKQQIISIYTAKGGVLKSTIAFNLGRTLASHGIKTLLVGLDVQESLTTLALGDREFEDLEDVEESIATATPGLYHFLKEGREIGEVVRQTDLPTLDVLPETFELTLLEKELRSWTRRESTFVDYLLPFLGGYEVVVFDNSPNWSLLIENALVASNVVLAPVSCEVGTYLALDKNLKALLEFKNAMRIAWDHYLMMPTLLNNSKISKQILGAYLIKHKEQVMQNAIRRTIKGEEAVVLKKSIFEFAPKSPLANDYDAAFVELWGRINGGVQ